MSPTRPDVQCGPDRFPSRRGLYTAVRTIQGHLNQWSPGDPRTRTVATERRLGERERPGVDHLGTGGNDGVGAQSVLPRGERG